MLNNLCELYAASNVVKYCGKQIAKHIFLWQKKWAMEKWGETRNKKDEVWIAF